VKERRLREVGDAATSPTFGGYDFDLPEVERGTIFALKAKGNGERRRRRSRGGVHLKSCIGCINATAHYDRSGIRETHY